MNEKGLSTLKIYEQKLKYLNYSEKTIKIYTWYINQFLKSQSKSCEHLNSGDFQSYLDNYKFTSITQQNQVINAIKFLYEKVLGKKYDKVSFERPKKERHLPQVIDKNHIINQINKINNLKHKAILSLTFSVGLRVSEVVNLKIEDIDSRRMLIHIKNAKGRKDRIVPLSENILKLLRNYFRIFRPKEYLFNGQFQLKYSVGSCQKIFKKYIDEKSHFHILRHSCFTSLLECGTDLRIIQKMAGHSSSKTTEIYTHVSTALLQKVALPL
jgi:site-specific recombinase XerD